MTNPFGIYVHIPFCVHKCSYCDFYSFTKYSENDFAELTRVIVSEIEEAARWLKDTRGYQVKLTSVFFGGGTPSLLAVPLLKKICDAIETHFPLEGSCEITTEANPETVSATWLSDLKKYTPINRISLGAQSFNQEYLNKLERLCGPEKVIEAVGLIKEAGYHNFNLDLIMAIPGQTTEQVEEDLNKVSELNPSHISSYTLSLKPGHALYEQLPEENLSADLYEYAVRSLANKGYKQYEISNYAREGKECAHNLLYWTGGDYLGVGPSAAGRFFFDGVFHHKKNSADMNLYLKNFKDSLTQYEVTTPKQTILEASFLELRCNRGVSLEHFLKRYGWDFRKSSQFELMLQHQMIRQAEGILYLTDKGRLLADTVTSRLVD